MKYRRIWIFSLATRGKRREREKSFDKYGTQPSDLISKLWDSVTFPYFMIRKWYYARNQPTIFHDEIFHLAWQKLRQSMWTFLIKKNIPHHSSSFTSHPLYSPSRRSLFAHIRVRTFFPSPVFYLPFPLYLCFLHPRFHYMLPRCCRLFSHKRLPVCACIGLFAFKLNRQIIRIVIMIFISFITIIILCV